VVQFDLPEKPRTHAVHIELRTFDEVDWKPDILRFHMSTFRVDNPGKRRFDRLPPATYAVERSNETKTGEHSVLMTDCERKLVRVESGKDYPVRFAHDAGVVVDGVVKGLEGSDLRYATVSIGYWGPPEEPREDGRRSRVLTHFDVIPITADGHFQTDQMPPGTYEFELFAVLSSQPEQQASTSSDFQGHTQFTIPEKGNVDRVEITATPRFGKNKPATQSRPAPQKSEK
jgi:hypothetical protein